MKEKTVDKINSKTFDMIDNKNIKDLELLQKQVNEENNLITN